MRVFLDARILHIGGTLTYATNLVDALVNGHGESVEFTVLFAKGQPQPATAAVRKLTTLSRRPAVWIPADAWRLPRLVRQSGAELFHSLKRPQIGVVGTRRIITIHSAYPWLHPEFRSKIERLYWAPFMARAARQAEAVVAVSETDRRNLLSLLDLAPERVTVIPCGIDPRFRTPPGPGEVERFRQRFGLPERYLLFVGNAYLAKNIPNVIRAFRIAAKQADLPHALVVVGGGGAGQADVEAALDEERTGPRVIRTGPLKEVAPALYAGADLFLFPTTYDSFGMPVLEAMACGTPTLISTAGALGEVAGDAAVAVDPGDPEAIAEALVRTLRDEERLASLRSKGLARAARFTWERSAELTVDLYRRVLDG